jgi:hypothetical protein
VASKIYKPDFWVIGDSLIYARDYLGRQGRQLVALTADCGRLAVFFEKQVACLTYPVVLLHSAFALS